MQYSIHVTRELPVVDDSRPPLGDHNNQVQMVIGENMALLSLFGKEPFNLFHGFSRRHIAIFC